MDTNITTDPFSPIAQGPPSLANRIVIAPLTRSRAQAGGVQGELNATDYAQRASAGRIISEATNISRQARGYLANPALVERLRDAAPLASAAPKQTWYGGREHGYTGSRQDGTL